MVALIEILNCNVAKMQDEEDTDLCQFVDETVFDLDKSWHRHNDDDAV